MNATYGGAEQAQANADRCAALGNQRAARFWAQIARDTIAEAGVTDDELRQAVAPREKPTKWAVAKFVISGLVILAVVGDFVFGWWPQ